jgi:hypothetical protein
VSTSRSRVGPSWNTFSPTTALPGVAYVWSADGVSWHVADAGVPVDNQALASQGIAPHNELGAMVIDPATGYLFQAIGCSAGMKGKLPGCPDQPGTSLTGGAAEVGVSVLKPQCLATAANCPEITPPSCQPEQHWPVRLRDLPACGRRAQIVQPLPGDGIAGQHRPWDRD